MTRHYHRPLTEDERDTLVFDLIAGCAGWLAEEWPALCRWAIPANTTQDTPDSVVADAVTWMLQDQRETFLADVVERIKMSWRKSPGGLPL